jgi:phosphoribosylformimino-5-aminoimidazole carboxamide ribotide isomerase
MILYPAIDLKDGQCVRLKRGAMEEATVFNADPEAQAKAFADAGSPWLHVVDLNGAFAGKSVNADAVRAILGATAMQVQLGGGIRELWQIEAWLTAGLARVILGTVALRNPALVKEAAKLFPGKVAVGIDAKAGMVAVEGWAEVSDMEATTLARMFEDAGIAAIIYTDIARDGVMQGPNLEETAKLAEAVNIPVILSGGISSLDDIRAVKAAENRGIAGVIVGRALYEGAVDLAEALEVVNGEQ